MKNNILRTLCAAALLVPMLWSCQRERIEAEATKISGPAMHAAISGTICGSTSNAGIADANGNQVIDYCSDGFSQVPCGPNPGLWGAITYAKYTNSGFPDANLNIDVTLGAGWFTTDYAVLVGPTGAVVTNGNLPVVNSNYLIGTINPFLNQFSIDLPLSATEYPAGCLDWALRMNVVQLDIFGSPLPGSNRTLYAYDPTGAGSPFVIDHCYDACPSPVVSSAQGICQGCRAAVTTTFTGCNSVNVSSCKAINQVVIVYTDCSREYHDNLTGSNYTYAAAAGKTISHVYVRSGCRANSAPSSQDNIDTNGFTYTNVLRFQFDGPCRNQACN